MKQYTSKWHVGQRNLNRFFLKIELNKDESKAPKFVDAAKSVVKRKFIGINAYLRKKKKDLKPRI